MKLLRSLQLVFLSFILLSSSVEAKHTKYTPPAVFYSLSEYMAYHCKKQCVSEEDLLKSVMDVSGKLDIDFKDLLAIVTVESKFHPKAKSGKNQGLMQVNIRYHKDKLKGKNVYHVQTNIVTGGTIYKDCLNKFSGNRSKAFRCFNGGGDPKYVLKINRAYKEISSFYEVKEPQNAEVLQPVKEGNEMTVKINLYCSGGTGMNLGKIYAKFANQVRPGFASLNVIFIDTSDANLDERVPADKFFRIEGVEEDNKVDGSGKLRKKNYDAIDAAVAPILRQYPPAEINILMNSTGGGSGSVIGPLLLAALLERGENVVNVVVGITSCGQEVKNTRDTLMSYENIATSYDKPVNVFYRENTGRSRQEVDKEVHTFIAGLTALFSGDNRELDTEDYRNFLDYPKVTNYPPQLTFIDLFSQNVTLDKGQALVSLLTVVDSEEDMTESNIPTEYQTVGFIHPGARSSFKAAAPIHMAIIAGFFNPVISDLEKRTKNFEEVRSLNTNRSIIKSPVAATKKGIIL